MTDETKRIIRLLCRIHREDPTPTDDQQSDDWAKGVNDTLDSLLEWVEAGNTEEYMERAAAAHDTILKMFKKDDLR